jgi:hypothetical protein
MSNRAPAKRTRLHPSAEAMQRRMLSGTYFLLRTMQLLSGRRLANRFRPFPTRTSVIYDIRDAPGQF